jgi:hypothetical protein
VNINTSYKGIERSYPYVDVKQNPMSGILSSAGFFNAHARQINSIMSIKSTIAAAFAAPFLLSSAAFAGPYVNVEANGSYPDGEYSSGNLEAQVGYEGVTEGGLAWYVSAGPTVNHTETADEFGDVELAGYLGASKSLTESVSAYGEVYGQTTASDDNDFSGKVGVKFVF